MRVLDCSATHADFHIHNAWKAHIGEDGTRRITGAGTKDDYIKPNRFNRSADRALLSRCNGDYGGDDGDEGETHEGCRSQKSG